MATGARLCDHCGMEIPKDCGILFYPPCGHRYHALCGISHARGGVALCSACPNPDHANVRQELSFGDDRRRRNAASASVGRTAVLEEVPLRVGAPSGAGSGTPLAEKPRSFLVGLAKLVGAGSFSPSDLLGKRIPSSKLAGEHGVTGESLLENRASASTLLKNGYGARDFLTLKISWPQLVDMGLGAADWKEHRSALMQAATEYGIDFLHVFETCDFEFDAVLDVGFSAEELLRLKMTGNVAVELLGLKKTQFMQFPFKMQAWKALEFRLEHLKKMGIAKEDVSGALKWTMAGKDLAFERLFEDTFSGKLEALSTRPEPPKGSDGDLGGEKRAIMVATAREIARLVAEEVEEPPKDSPLLRGEGVALMFSDFEAAKKVLRCVASWDEGISMTFSSKPPRGIPEPDLRGIQRAFVAATRGAGRGKRTVHYAFGCFDEKLFKIA